MKDWEDPAEGVNEPKSPPAEIEVVEVGRQTDHVGSSVLDQLSRDPVPQGEALRLARSGDLLERTFLAANPHLDRAALEVLANDPEDHVAQALLQNYSLPLEIWAMLCRRFNDEAEMVSIIRGHPSASADVKMALSLREITHFSLDKLYEELGVAQQIRRNIDSLEASEPNLTVETALRRSGWTPIA